MNGKLVKTEKCSKPFTTLLIQNFDFEKKSITILVLHFLSLFSYLSGLTPLNIHRCFQLLLDQQDASQIPTNESFAAKLTYAKHCF